MWRFNLFRRIAFTLNKKSRYLISGLNVVVLGFAFTTNSKSNDENKIKRVKAITKLNKIIKITKKLCCFFNVFRKIKSSKMIFMFLLTDKLEFPPVHTATPEGVVAVGGDLSPERLMLAYKKGIFPWFEEDTIIIWWSPDPRMVLYPHKLKISKSMRKLIEKNTFRVTYNTCFEKVIRECASIRRKDQESTWLTKEMIRAYCKLHELGKAISVEVWQDDNLVGGLYGIDIFPVFCGESMFSKVSNASKYAFIHYVMYLSEKNYTLIDCQVYTKHLASLGAEEIKRDEFLKYL